MALPPPLDLDGLDEARARTIARGRRLRRRRAGLLAGTATAALVLVGSVVGLAGGGDHRDRVDVVDDPTTTTKTGEDDEPARPSPTTTEVPPASATTATTEPPPVEAPDDGDGAAPPVDDDAPDPWCTTITGQGNEPRADWAEWWQTEPAYNDPITLDLCVTDLAPDVGDLVHVELSASDPDNVFVAVHPRYGWCPPGVGCLGMVDFGDEGDGFPDYGDRRPGWTEPPARPVPTPPENPGTIQVTTGHTYTAPGTYLITVVLYSYNIVVDVPGDGTAEVTTGSPYHSTVETTLTVTVE